MSNFRLIPRLDIKGPNLVKGIHLEGLRVLGKPEYFAKHYYENNADELLFMDAVASLYDRSSVLEIVETTAKHVFIPLIVGGGLRSIEDIRKVLHAGADKVAINTAAVKKPEFIKESARHFGSSTIVGSIEAICHGPDNYEVYIDNGREKTGCDVFTWAKQLAELGAGELMVTAIDREGTAKGFDIPLIQKISTIVPIPVIACGGAGCVEHIIAAAKLGQVQGVGIASILHYNLAKQQSFSKIEKTSLKLIKQSLLQAGVPTRV